MIIIGAGISGLLAARSFIYANPLVIEQQEDLPNNHSALLRFRSSIVGDTVGIPFKEVNVYKGVLREDGSITNSPTIRDYNAYSLKTTGQAAERSIININTARRCIAPDNFIPLLAYGASIKYDLSAESFLTDERNGREIISTIPMPALMRILNYPVIPKFQQITIWTINCKLVNTNVYQTLYVPYDDNEPYRVSITGDIMTLEFAYRPTMAPEHFIEKYLSLMSLLISYHIDSIDIKKQDYGKIVPIDNYERRKFILWATDKFNIYSLGRYATWRNILLDDVIKDIQIIKSFITQRSDYHRTMHWEK